MLVFVLRQRRMKPPRLQIPLQPLQIRANLRCALISEVAILLQALVHYPLEIDRQIGIEP